MKSWKIGYAQRDITPTTGHNLMAGYGRERYAAGVLTPLRAQAAALRDAAGRTALLLAADVICFDRVGVETIRHALAREHKLPPQAVMIASSHTHWGPGFLYTFNYAAGGIDVWYRKRLEDSLIELAGEALKDLKAGTIAYTALDAKIGHNRRLPGPRGKGLLWGPYPEGSYDTHTPVLLLERGGTKGPTRIVLVGHACHPTSTGLTDKWSADYPGAMRERIEERLGKNTRAMFVMGCGADAKVCHTDAATGKPAFSASPAQSRAGGRRLAAAVLEHLREASPLPLPPLISCRLARGELKFEKAWTRKRLEAVAYDDTKTHHGDVAWARQSLAYPDSRRTFTYEVQAWRFGDVLTLIGLEGEVCSPLGPLARSLVGTGATMVAAYVNAVEGYIPSQRIRREGGYEGDTSHRAYFLPAPFTPNVEKEFAAIVARALR